ncbi:MAG: amidase [Pseudomonadota bacterium]
MNAKENLLQNRALLERHDQCSMLDPPELCTKSVEQLSSAYRLATLSPVEVTEANLMRADEVDTALNAFSLIDHEGALQAARLSEERWRNGTPLGPLDGIPVTIKDAVTVKGWPSRYGSRTTDATPQQTDSPTARLLRQSGAILLGQTAIPEFGWKALTDSSLYGITRNPWNPNLTPGGSSGGAAVAAATGAGVLHLGTDGGGSIRVPASFTGVVGHKPTFGRVPAYPPSPFGTLSHIGPIARRVADASLMLEVLSGRDQRDWNQNPLTFTPPEGLPAAGLAEARIGVWTIPPTGSVAYDVAAQFAKAAAKIGSLGAILEPVSPPLDGALELFHLMWFSGAAGVLSGVNPSYYSGMDRGLVAIADAGRRFSAADYIAAGIRRAEFGAAMEKLFETFDLIISPTTAITPFVVGAEVPLDSGLKRWTEWAGFSFPLNLSQQPACTVPCGHSAQGLPIGLQIIGPRGADWRVLRAAAICEDLFRDQ